VYSKLSVYIYEERTHPTVLPRPKSLHKMQIGRTDIKFTGVLRGVFLCLYHFIKSNFQTTYLQTFGGMSIYYLTRIMVEPVRR